MVVGASGIPHCHPFVEAPSQNLAPATSSARLKTSLWSAHFCASSILGQFAAGVRNALVPPPSCQQIWTWLNTVLTTAISTLRPEPMAT
mmetsp:Transcript_17859/g.20661  ORF Transcript_17859/g.20661 Transcript_17859/m.20661 type:complete len:89 (-) Transcript_17859:23-289(-)